MSPVAAALSFFVAETPHRSGDLGGLDGADRRCRELAAQVGAGDRDWRAFLSAAGPAPAHARDRIGDGPWYDAAGALVARDLEHLLSEASGLDATTALTATGARPAAHDVLTGSGADGRLAWIDGRPATCGDWTRRRGAAAVGHLDRMRTDSHGNPRFPHLDGSWAFEHASLGCSAAALAGSGGDGAFYCFAADPREPLPARVHAPATFRRGINVNHWLGDNLDPSLLPDAHYGAAWFGEDDVAWIAAQGFDHVRLWVSGHAWLRPDGQLDEAALAPFVAALGWAEQHGLGVILALYSTPGFRTTPRGAPPDPADVSLVDDAAARRDAAYLWWAVARRFAEVGPALRFETIVAPAADLDAAFSADALAAIRRVSPDRVVHVPHAEAATDPSTVVSVDLSAPEAFTFQLDPATPPAPLTDADLAALEVAVDALTAGGRAPYVARFGVYRRAEDPSIRRYLAAARAALERRGLSWAVYDYHTGFRVRDLATGEGTAALDGLFPAAP